MTSVGAWDTPKVRSALGSASQLSQKGGKEHCHGVLLDGCGGHTLKASCTAGFEGLGRLVLQSPHGWGCPYLSPLAGDPAGWGAAPQVAPHAGGGLGGLVALGRGQGHAVVATLAQDDAVAEAGPAAWGALQGQGTWGHGQGKEGTQQLGLPRAAPTFPGS